MKKLSQPLLLSVLLILIIMNISCKKEPEPDYTDVILASMTIEDKIGQMLMFGFPGTEMTGQAEMLLKKYRPGGIILFGFNIKNRKQLTDFTSSMQNSAAGLKMLPLMISTDQEGGKVRRVTDGITVFPGNMSIGAANDPDLAYSIGRITGMELRLCGINMNLAPDVDINSNPDNPVINVRSFGSNREIVSAMGSSYIKGIQSSKCMAVAKHFPGHGDTSIDSHKSLPQINHSIDYLRQNEFVPFKTAIESGVSGIMSAHIAFPEILGDDTPATLSPYFLNEILQNELKFPGIIMTDDLEMGAIGKNNDPGEAALKAVNSGVDILLFTTFSTSLEKIYDSLIAAYYSGHLTEKRIDQSASKIIRAKLQFSIAGYDKEKSEIVSGSYVLSDEDMEILKTAENINRQAAEKGVYYYSMNKSFAAASGEEIFISGEAAFAEYIDSPELKYIHKSGLVQAVKNSKSNAKKIYYFTHRYHDPVLRKLMILHKTHSEIELRVISTGNPYDLTGRGELPPVLFTFGNTPSSYAAILKYIKGEIVPGENADIDLGFVR